MSPLMIRRIVVWIASMLLGALVTLAILTLVLPWKNSNSELVGITEYGLGYFIGTAFPLGLVFVTILDHLMDTKIWPD